MLVLVGLAVFVPASDVAVAVINALVCHILPPRVLPKLNFSSGVSADCRTIVVIPGMLTKPESRCRRLCERLELHYLANPDPQLRFALLTDWADAPTESAPTDDALVKRGHRWYSALKPAVRPRRPGRVLPLPSQAQVQSVGRRVDGVGAEARQARRVRPLAARCDRHELHRAHG